MYKGINQARQLANSNTIEKYARDMANNPADEFNANSAYLMLLTRTMENWTFILYYGIDGKKDTPDFYNQLISCCDVFLDLMAARITEDKVSKFGDLIDEQKTLLSDAFWKDGEGQTRYNKDKCNKLLRNIRHIFRNLMSEMQRIGMLTKLHLAPGDAITELE